MGDIPDPVLPGEIGARRTDARAPHGRQRLPRSCDQNSRCKEVFLSRGLASIQRMQWGRVVEIAEGWWRDRRRRLIRRYARKVFANWHLALSRLTTKQREAAGRFLHTLSAASLSGAAVIVGTAWPFHFWDVARILLLASVGVLCFLCGAVMSKGER